MSQDQSEQISYSFSTNKDNVFKVLSIDGGGIKGVYSARILEQFEQKFGCQISDYFDLICGTSTGGLIALGLSLNIPARDITQFYYNKGEENFEKQSLHKFFLKQLIWGGKNNN